MYHADIIVTFSNCKKSLNDQEFNPSQFSRYKNHFNMQKLNNTYLWIYRDPIVHRAFHLAILF